MRRIGVLMPLAADDPEGKARIAAFLQALQQLGWTDSRNVRIDYRWGAGDADRTRRYASELVALAPDVVVATGSPAVGALQLAASTVPIVFVAVVDPVGAGFIDSLARPGGNATGFTNFEYGMSGKWLELLKEIAPRSRLDRRTGRHRHHLLLRARRSGDETAVPPIKSMNSRRLIGFFHRGIRHCSACREVTPSESPLAAAPPRLIRPTVRLLPRSPRFSGPHPQL